MRPFAWMWLTTLLAALAGCGDGHDVADLKAFTDAARARPTGVIEPIPRFTPYQAFTYEASGLRSPFQPAVKIDLARRQQGLRKVQPDPNRLKQFLEGFNIEQFEMVGILANAKSRFALLKGAGGVYRVKVGDFLGRSDGRIVAIGDSQVDIVEIVPDGEGGWLERPRTLLLRERS
ncbi:pilus assembly protein PilP [Pseudomonas sp. R5(2019)]|uniref:pilus assembly protein PilP n=1 Tax=Pseudomonas sp. R5(2019) TaxID=2697566 RepID=UPI001413741A|nr:pilus assembly protein PilP [Pseudomonas sp. R5(2019)]NBA94023.1 pilus assembly protein PilP [Pseudomonas sp. R5(2019)]